MAKRCCANCVYSYWSLHMKLSGFTPGFPCGPLCANHPDTPGQLRRVSSGGVCRNYRPKPAATEGDIKRIPLGEGQYALVDAADYEWLKQWTWRLQNGYAVRYENGRTIYMHREIMKPPEGMLVDHINHNKLDNCRSNLRVCTRQENMCNRGKCPGSSSRFKGVGYSKEQHKWSAKIMVRRANRSGSAILRTRSKPPAPTTARRSNSLASSPASTSPKNGRRNKGDKSTPTRNRCATP